MVAETTYILQMISAKRGNFQLVISLFDLEDVFFCQVIGMLMETNYATLHVDLFLFSYENELLDIMIRSGHRRLARSLDICFRYTDDLTIFNNKKFSNYLNDIYPIQLTLEKANKSDHLARYLDLTIMIDSCGKLLSRLFGQT